MARKATKAEVPADLWPVLSPTQFQGQFDVWLREHEAAKPFSELRELHGRIDKGERQIKAALAAGKVTPEDDSYKAAVAKLDALKARRNELTRTAQVPFIGMNTAHNFLRGSRGWGLPTGSYIAIEIPGVFGIKVDVSEQEPPF